MTSVQPTVDAINRSLQAYGFNGFSIVPSPKDDKRYQIKRPNGSIASETLSEGEETFISFLYYVYKLPYRLKYVNNRQLKRKNLRRKCEISYSLSVVRCHSKAQD